MQSESDVKLQHYISDEILIGDSEVSELQVVDFKETKANLLFNDSPDSPETCFNN